MISSSLRPLGFRKVLYCLKEVLLLGMLIGLASVEASGAQAKSVGQALNAIGSLMVVRDDGIQESLQGTGSLPLFEGDTLKTEQGNQGLIVFDNGVQVAVNEDTEFLIISRWEKDKPLTRILRLKKGELLVKITEGPKPFEVETPVASARVKQTEFDIKVQENGETTLRVIEGIVEFGTPFGTCPIRTATISYGVRGKKCTKPKEENHQTALLWAKDLVK